MGMAKFSHFINDPQYPDRALTFVAHDCPKCGTFHRITRSPIGVTLWRIAALNLEQVDAEEIPATRCRAEMK